MKRFALALLAVCILTGCSPIERTAYNSVVAAKAFLDSVKLAHPECNPGTSTLCVDLRKATSAKDVIIDASEAYCRVSAFSDNDVTACNPTPSGTPIGAQTLAALQAALSNYKVVEADLKGVIK